MKKIILYLKQIFATGKTNGNAEQKPTTHEGDFVQLVWMIERLRNVDGCSMNELIREVSKEFNGLEGIKKK